MRSTSEVDGSGLHNQVNSVSSVLDGGTVYGHSASRLEFIMDDAALAVNGDEIKGNGRLRTSTNVLGYQMLPFNVKGLHNGGGDDKEDLFLAGDIRVNEQLGLIVIHTLWVREHNYWADFIRSSQPNLTGKEVFEMARTVSMVCLLMKIFC